MTRGAKMFLATTARNRPERDGNREARMEREPEANRWMPPYYGVEINRYEYGPHEYTDRESPMRGNYDMDSRFRDRRGREHYDNGRFAPMSRMDDHEMETRNMRMIGFDRQENKNKMGGSDASMPKYREMDHMPGDHVKSGGAESKRYPRLDERTAAEWTSGMMNADGTMGPHWSMEQTNKLIEQRGINKDPVAFWAVINSIYSDDVAVAKKHGVNKLDYYVDRAIAWLDDKDAVKDKAAIYYEYVVEH